MNVFGDVLPENLFSTNENAITFEGVFKATEISLGKGSLITIPENFFANNKKVTNLSFAFCSFGNNMGTQGMNRVYIEIPSKLFEHNIEVTTFAYCFYKLRKWKGIIPEELFYNNTKVIDFSYCFYVCSHWAEYDCANTVIPINIFKNCPNVETFEGCFYNCRVIGYDLNDIFSNCHKVKNFSYCFASVDDSWDTYNSINISETLFSNSPDVTTFSHCFERRRLTKYGIPENLFASNTKVIDFSYTFSDTRVYPYGSQIPKNLFANNPNVETFECCFYYCAAGIVKNPYHGDMGYMVIPSELFKNNIKAVNFSRCFGVDWASTIYAHCTVPIDLFSNAVNAEIFDGCFVGNDINTLPDDFFSATKAKSFVECFRNTTMAYAPQIWLIFPTAEHTNCFGGNSDVIASLANYDDIPDDWK